MPAGGFVDVWWRFTPTNPGLVQGIKIDVNNHAFNSPTVRIDGVMATTANPYSYNNLAPGAHTLSTTVPEGFTAAYAMCVNCTNSVSSTFTAGSSVSVRYRPEVCRRLVEVYAVEYRAWSRRESLRRRCQGRCGEWGISRRDRGSTPECERDRKGAWHEGNGYLGALQRCSADFWS